MAHIRRRLFPSGYWRYKKVTNFPRRRRHGAQYYKSTSNPPYRLYKSYEMRPWIKYFRVHSRRVSSFFFFFFFFFFREFFFFFLDIEINFYASLRHETAIEETLKRSPLTNTATIWIKHSMAIKDQWSRKTWWNLIFKLRETRMPGYITRKNTTILSDESEQIQISEKIDSNWKECFETYSSSK